MIDFNRYTLVLLLSSLFALFSCEKQDKIWSSNRYLISYTKEEVTLEKATKYVQEHYASLMSDLRGKTVSGDADTTNTVSVYKIVYRTPSNNFGSDTQCSGIVVVPHNIPTRQVLAFHHTWMADKDVPSVAGFSLESFLAFGNSVVIVPDYMGFGASFSEQSPYMNLRQNFNTNADMLKAAWELFETLELDTDLPLYVAGYSQGGYSALSFQYMVENEYSGVSDFNIRQVIAGAAPADLSAMMNCVTKYDYIEAEVPPALIFLGMDAAMNLEIDFDNVFKGVLKKMYPEWILSKKYDKAQIESFMAADKKPSNFLHKDFFSDTLNADIRKILEKIPEVSIPSDWSPGAPLLLIHGSSDSLAYYEAMRPMYAKLQANGKDVVIYIVEGKTHYTAMVDYLRELFAICR